ncbi:MAG TPA: oligosaccharide flippase family protein [Woeseiaceae bacterium]|nr:oligosaccharide flippase family protein [Woeseiaceae bacterium]
MSTLIQSTLILAFTRVTNYVLLFFSPILLVRILDPATFGQYREFVAWSMITTSIAAFSISSNLLYFVPRHPENTRRYVSHTALMTLFMSLLACGVLWLFGDAIRSGTSFDLLPPLSIYVFLYVNVTFLDRYWIATKQPKYVFYYSTIRTGVRLSAVIGTAWATRSIEAIVAALIGVETLRVMVVLAISRGGRLLSFGFDRRVLAEQLAFILPLGIATSLAQVHQYVGQLVISTQLGVVALAVYSIASFKVPIIRMVRGAVSEAIFPDMVRQAASDRPDRLRLWKRGNVAYTFLVLPAFLLLFWYADVLIPLVFTERYVDAVPIFRVLLLMMPLETIELNSPLRAIKRTPDMLAGNLLLLGTNLLCMVIFFRWFPEHAIFGPAVGVVAGQLAQLAFLASRVLHWYRIPLHDLLKWRSQGAIWLCTMVSGLLLIVGDYVPVPELWRIASFALVYGAGYFVLIRLFRLEEVETLWASLCHKLRRAPA